MITALVTSILVLSPQEPPSGPLSDVPVVMTAPGSSVGDELGYVNLPGTTVDLLSDELTFYSRSCIFDPDPIPVFNAVSRGKSTIPATRVDRASDGKDIVYGDVEGTSWTYSMISVTANTLGKPGSAYRLETKPEGCLFVVMGGTDVPAEYKGIIHKVRDADNMGVNDVTSVDSYAYAGLLESVNDGPVHLYFSVAPGSPSEYSTSSIYKVSYSNGSWGDVVEFRNHVALGLESDDEIDALSVQELSEGEQTGYKILLSTSSNSEPVSEPNDKELWMYWEAPGVLDGIYRGPYYHVDQQTLFVNHHFNFDAVSDGIDGICTDDPPAPNGEYPPHLEAPETAYRVSLDGFPMTSSVTDAFHQLSLSSHLNFKKVGQQRRERIKVNFRMRRPMVLPGETYEIFLEKSFNYLETAPTWEEMKKYTVHNPSRFARFSATWVLPTPGQAALGKSVFFRARVTRLSGSTLYSSVNLMYYYD